MIKIREKYEQQLVVHGLDTHVHCENVGCLMREFATWLHESPEVIHEAYIAGMWHDIGKLWIPQQMLQKEEKLSKSEWGAIKKHSYLGYFFLDGHNSLAGVASYVLYHHERYDGQGYPKGLKEEEIPFVSRMLAICDAFDAMINGRPYRMAISPEEALVELQKNIGLQFDPKLVRSFSELVRKKFMDAEFTNLAYPIKISKDTMKEHNVKSIDEEVESILTELSQLI